MLFTDLVGSTEQRSRLGDDAADELRQDHDRLIGDAVIRHAGQVVKSTGDGLLAVFGSAADALDAAVAAQQAVESRNRLAREPLGVRTGVSIGDVSVEDDGDVFGTPVVEAGRLCDLASGGQILCTDFVRGMAGTRGGHSFDSLGGLELKGLPAPITAHAVRWSATTELPPVPSVLIRSHTYGFVGRAAELDLLRQAWKETLAAGPTGVLLSGEPGSGKTRLMAEFAVEVHADGATVLAGRCDEGLGVPYQPFVEAFRHWVEHTPEPQRIAGLGQGPGELCSLLPQLGDLVPDLPDAAAADADTMRYRMFEAVASWLRAVAAQTPVLLVLDDLHWATAPTLHLLRHVLRVESSRFLVVGTYRETDLDRTHPLADLLAELRRDGASERIPLGGLGPADVEAFVAAAAGQDRDASASELARAIHAETDGNPFFVESVLVHLVESGGVRIDEGGWVLNVAVEDLGIPEGVREVIGRRLARLSSDADALLHLASLAGEEFDVAVVEHAADLEAAAFDLALDEAAAAGLIGVDDPAPGRARFGHALVRATIAEEIVTHRRVRLHRRLGEAIEAVHAARLDDHLPALANHFAEAAIGGEADKAVTYLRRAADAAYHRLATDEAIRHIDRAVSLLEITDGNDQLEAELWFERGQIRRLSVTSMTDRSGQDDLLRAAELAESRHDAALLARVALAFPGAQYILGVRSPDRTRLALIEGALEALGEGETAVHADLLSHLANELTFGVEFERRRRVADRALALARAADDPDVLCGVLMRRPYTVLETAEDHLALSEEAARLVTDTTRPIYRPWMSWTLAMARLRVGDVDGARPVAEEFFALVARSGPGIWQLFAWSLEYYLAFWDGDLPTAIAARQKRAEVGARYTDVDTTRFERCDRSLELHQLAAVGVAELDVGDESAARKRRAVLEAAAFGSGDPDPPGFLVLCGQAGELFARTGGHSDAEVMYRAAFRLRHGTEHAGGRLTGCASVQRECAWWASILGDHDCADDHLEASLAFHSTQSSPTNVALDHLTGAWIRHLRGDNDDAKAQFAAARAAAPANWPRFDQRAGALLRSMS